MTKLGLEIFCKYEMEKRYIYIFFNLSIDKKRTFLIKSKRKTDKNHPPHHQNIYSAQKNK